MHPFAIQDDDEEKKQDDVKNVWLKEHFVKTTTPYFNGIVLNTDKSFGLRSYLGFILSRRRCN